MATELVRLLFVEVRILDWINNRQCENGARSYAKLEPSVAVKLQGLVSRPSLFDAMRAPPVKVQPVVPVSKEPFSTTSVNACLRSALGAAKATAEP